MTLVLNKLYKYFLRGEDKYQFDKKKKCGNAYIKSWYVYDEIGSKTIEDKVNKLVELYIKYGKFYDEPDIERSLLVKKGELELSEIDSNVINFAIGYNQNTIFTFLDHVYLGTSFFHDGGAILADSTGHPISYPPNICVQLMTSFKFLYNRFYEIPYESTLSRCDQLKRLYFKLDLNEIKNPKFKTTSTIVHKCLHDIILRTDKDYLRAYVTYGFKHTKSVHNNIGIIFIDITRDMSVGDIEKQIEDKKYQVAATNFLMKFVGSGSGKKVRSSVDIVMSIGYLKTEENHILESHFTFLTKSDYPIYCCSLTNGNDIHVNYTVSTDDVRI